MQATKEEYSGPAPFVPRAREDREATPTHVVVVTWVEKSTLTILAQAPVPHADKTKKRVLFMNHQPGRVPQLEAIGIARSIARKNKRPDTLLA